MSHQTLYVIGTVRRIGDKYIVLRIVIGRPYLVTIFFFVVDI